MGFSRTVKINQNPRAIAKGKHRALLLLLRNQSIMKQYSTKRTHSLFQTLFSLALLLLLLPHEEASAHYYFFAVKEAPYRRLCERKKILTVNGEFPGPTIRVHKGETIYVYVHNKANSNITMHWHGVKQPRHPWSDGPEYITQCPIQPGAIFKQKLIFSEEEGTLWWHAHSTWSRATVHGAIVIYPNHSSHYPFPTPSHQLPVILGEWWKKDVREVYEQLVRTGGDAIASDALTINGQPGELFPCSKSETFKLVVDQGSSYLLRIVNAAMNSILFFSVADHNITVVAVDGSYTKPLTTHYIAISPGQTLDALLLADRPPHRYYMAARAFSSRPNIIPFDNTTATAVVQYRTRNQTPWSSPPSLPHLPFFNDTAAAFGFFTRLRSSSANVPKHITSRIVSTVSINTLPCGGRCEGPNGTRFAASMNNISFVLPSMDILEAYYYRIKGVYQKGFPKRPPLEFNYTAEDLRAEWEVPRRGRRVKVLEYGAAVEIVLQGTSLVGATDHPMHLHGHSFYVVGLGFGNFDQGKDPQRYNLVDPPLRNTATVPANGWITVRFWATNPGVWYMHCHLERHLTWGMNTVFIVKNGNSPETQLLPPPPDMPPC